MTADVVFKTQSTPIRTPRAEVKPTDKQEPQDRIDKVEPPYLDYETVNGRPYLVDHFKLDDHWQEPLGGYPKELAIIDGYISSQIKEGKTGNDVASAKEILKQAEKITNTRKETRSVIKLGILAEYMKFLMEADKIKFDAQRYART